MPGMPGIPGMFSATRFGAAFQPAVWNAVAAGLVTAFAGAQLCGTDNAPTGVARPTPADTAEPPRPGKPADAGAAPETNDDKAGMPDPPPRGGGMNAGNAPTP